MLVKGRNHKKKGKRTGLLQFVIITLFLSLSLSLFKTFSLSLSKRSLLLSVSFYLSLFLSSQNADCELSENEICHDDIHDDTTSL